MIRLTRIAFLRRHAGRLRLLKQELQQNYINQSQYNLRHRDELLNQIEGMEIESVFKNVAGFPMRRQENIIKEDEDLQFINPSAADACSKDAVNHHDFQDLEGEFERHGDFSSTRRNSRYQDLTHEERQELQHFEAQARLRDGNGLLNKNRSKIDPRSEAKKLVRELNSDITNMENLEESDHKEAWLVSENRFDEIVSRIRSKIRQEKKESSEVNKAKIPNFNGLIVDPITKHVKRRCLRINAMIKEQLEQIVTCNDPSFILGDMPGVSISLKSVEMTSSKSTIKCYYTILGDNVEEQRVQQLLEKAQGKVRFALARKLELGYTPPVVFIKADAAEKAIAKRAASSPDYAFNTPMETTLKSLREQFHKKMVAF